MVPASFGSAPTRGAPRHSSCCPNAELGCVRGTTRLDHALAGVHRGLEGLQHSALPLAHGVTLNVWLIVIGSPLWPTDLTGSLCRYIRRSLPTLPRLLTLAGAGRIKSKRFGTL